MKHSLLYGLVLLTGLSATAGEARWLRNTAVSPDGSRIAFTYQGDIYTVPVSGGTASRLTANGAYNHAPVWSNDGTQIIFAADIHGSDDIFIVDANGGTPRRLTTSSAPEVPIAVFPDGRILFTASQMPSQQTTRGTWLGQTYTIDPEKTGSRPELFLSMPMKSASIAPTGSIIYADRKGFEDPLRKHERSSGTSDIWVYNDGQFRKLTSFDGHDLNPVWMNGGSGYLYLSEQDGTLNVWQVANDGAQPRQLTHFTKHPVRSLSAADNGTFVFSWDGDIYVQTLADTEPKKLDIDIATDLYQIDHVKDTRSGGASNMAVSPKGDEIAFVYRGDIYVTDAKYTTTRRITNTPAQERSLAFSPDGRTIVYDSDRDGYWQLFTATIKDDKEERFTYATDIEEKPLYKCATSAMQPAYSPDGKKIAFLENRTEIRVIDPKTGKVTTALPGKFNYSYSDGDISFAWSPDSKWLLADYIGVGGWNNCDIALVKADGTDIIDLTESGYADGGAKWAMDGGALTYLTGKFGMKSQGSWGNQYDVILMALNSDAWDKFGMTEEEADLADKAKEKEKEGDKDSDKKGDKKDNKKKDKKSKKDAKVDEDKKDLEFELDDRRYRMARLTGNSALISDYYLTPKGDKLYYIAGATEGGRNLIERNLRTGDTKIAIAGVSGGIEADAKGENIFLLSGGKIKKLDLAGGKVEDVEFRAWEDRHPSEERAYMYEHMLRQVNDKFYDENLHGVDWKYYGDHYREFLPYISNNRDFAILLSEILGELNASHTGGRAYSMRPMLTTASLGAFYDPDYEGEGVRVTEVLRGGPLALKKSNVKAGDIILAIDGKKIEPGADYNALLEGKAGEKVQLDILKADGKKVRSAVKPISMGEQNNLLYRRWVDRNEAMVDSLSGGRIGYVHVTDMDGASYQRVYDRLLGKHRNCDAVIVDTRYNGGGWLHNDIAILLSGKEYVRFTPRDQYIGSEPFSQWTKPSVMLINESNYSDAHGTPFVYKTLGIGELVGAPVPGTMTAVWWESQIDPSIVFGIPQVTSRGMDGKVLENHQLNPDVLIYNNPADELRGRDNQIEGAVRHLLDKLPK